MGATNKSASIGRNFYKLKESEQGDSKGEYRFFKQVKIGDKWGDGEGFNTLTGTVTSVIIKEYEFEKEVKKQLVVTVMDDEGSNEFTMGLRSMTAQGILNTLAGGNGFDLSFSCGKPRTGKDGKFYPSLWINKQVGEDRKTNWKWQFADLPKVTTITDEDGNKIKRGQKAADEFWVKAVGVVQEMIKQASSTGNGDALFPPSEKTVGRPANTPVSPTDDLPF